MNDTTNRVSNSQEQVWTKLSQTTLRVELVKRHASSIKKDGAVINAFVLIKSQIKEPFFRYLHYRHFVDVFMTEEEAKAEAADALIDDIDGAGQKIQRPGTVNDRLPSPYPNKKAAAAANNGAAPPDLTLMALARHGGDDYMFSLLTSYFDAPAGVKVDEGKSYNPYFPGN